MGAVNWLAIGLCAVSSLALGAIWYAPILFGRAWQRGVGLSDEVLAKGSWTTILGLAFLLSGAAAWWTSVLIGRDPELGPAMGIGAALGLFCVASSFGISYLFERRGLSLWLINGGYHVVQFALFGLILSLLD